jgi:hypothetical protein
MNLSRPFQRTFLAFISALMVLFMGSSCQPSQPEGIGTPISQTLVVTQVVTREITREVTLEISVPVTVTPTPTLEFTYTPSLTLTSTQTPTITPIPELPRATIREYSDCLYGPANFYLYKTSYTVGSRVEVTGRSWDALWINVQEIQGWNACWIPAEQAELDSGIVADLPFVYTALPLARYEYSPPAAKVERNGNEVTVSWEAKWMSFDEIRGYLIEAWVCQDGEYTFLPIGISPTYAENVGTFSVKITDEAGCAEASRARIATVVKKGYTLFEKIFWPPP